MGPAVGCCCCAGCLCSFPVQGGNAVVKSKGRPRGYTSRFVGVTWDRAAGSWRARLAASQAGEPPFVFRAACEEAAARAYDEAALRLNKPVNDPRSYSTPAPSAVVATAFSSSSSSSSPSSFTSPSAQMCAPGFCAHFAPAYPILLAAIGATGIGATAAGATAAGATAAGATASSLAPRIPPRLRGLAPVPGLPVRAPSQPLQAPLPVQPPQPMPNPVNPVAAAPFAAPAPQLASLSPMDAAQLDALFLPASMPLRADFLPLPPHAPIANGVGGGGGGGGGAGLDAMNDPHDPASVSYATAWLFDDEDLNPPAPALAPSQAHALPPSSALDTRDCGTVAI